MTCNEPWASWSWRATACSARALPSPPPPSESCASHVSGNRSVSVTEGRERQAAPNLRCPCFLLLRESANNAVPWGLCGN